MPPLKLMVADSDLQACRHLLSLLSYYPNLQLQSCCHDFDELQLQCKQQPDLIFLDMHLTLIRSPGNFFEYYINSWRGPRSFG